MTKQYSPFVSSAGQVVHQVGTSLTGALHSLMLPASYSVAMLLVAMCTDSPVHLLTALADLQEVSVAKPKNWRHRTAAASKGLIKFVGKKSTNLVLSCGGRQCGVLVGLTFVQSFSC